MLTITIWLVRSGSSPYEFQVPVDRAVNIARASGTIAGVGLPGMVLALGAMGLLGWRRKRKAAGLLLPDR